jgi:hypothetical protein
MTALQLQAARRIAAIMREMDIELCSRPFRPAEWTEAQLVTRDQESAAKWTRNNALQTEALAWAEALVAEGKGGDE